MAADSSFDFGKKGHRSVVDRRKHYIADSPDFVFDDPVEKMLFRAEIVVEHGMGDACSLGNRHGSRSGVAFQEEFFLSSGKDFIFSSLPGFFLVRFHK